MSTWLERAECEKKRFKPPVVTLWIDDRLQGLNLSPRASETLNDGLTDLALRIEPGIENKPVSFIFNGSNRSKKKQLAEDLANRLGVDFIYVDCASYAERERACAGREPEQKEVIQHRSGAEPGERVEKAIALQVDSLGMVGWFFDTPPGYQSLDIGESFAARMRRDPNVLLYLENIDKSGNKFFGALCNTLESGVINGSRVERSGIPLTGCVLVFSTNLEYAEQPCDEISDIGRFNKLWQESVDEDDRFIYSCNILNTDASAS